jgi:hypothetical protein
MGGAGGGGATEGVGAAAMDVAGVVMRWGGGGARGFGDMVAAGEWFGVAIGRSDVQAVSISPFAAAKNASCPKRMTAKRILLVGRCRVLRRLAGDGYFVRKMM